MPVARLRAEAEGKLSFTFDGIEALAEALEVDADLIDGLTCVPSEDRGGPR
jgi:hypothetical protein